MKSYETTEDKFYSSNPISREYNGFFFDNLRFIQKEQLKNRQLWKDIVEVYRTKLDDFRYRWRSEFWGKLMRGASAVYLYTKDEELKQILKETVLDMLSIEDEHGRFSSYSIENEFNGWDMWGRKYILLGFEYYLQISEDKELNEKIISAMKRHADYILEKIGNGIGQIQIGETSNIWLCLNSFSILEPMVTLYNLTGEKRYFDFATYLVEEGGIAGEGNNIFDLAFENKIAPFEYPANKAYELMSVFEGLCEYYRVVKDEKYLSAITRFVDKLIATDITIIGCAGTMHEQLNNAKIKQTDDSYDGIMQETCVTVTFMKLCYQLYRLTGETKYIDEIENSAFNALLGSVNTEKSKKGFGFTFDSYTNLINGVRARESGGLMILNHLENGPFPGLIDLPKDAKMFGCCTAISALGFGLFVSMSIMQNKDGLAVNEYFDGETKFDFATIKTTTDYPYDLTVKMEIEAKKDFQIMLRVPSFSKDRYSIQVDDKILNLDAENGYIILNIKAGKTEISLMFDDRIKVILPFGIFGKDKYKALKYGTLVLAEDERLGYSLKDKINLDFDNEYVLKNYKKIKNTDIKNNIAFEIGNKQLIDYSSAGKEWDSDKHYSVWLLS